MDNVYKYGNEYYFVEDKYGSSTLSMTQDGLQLSDPWILNSPSDRLLKAVNNDAVLTQITIAKGYKRVLANISADGSVIFQEVDAFGNIIGPITL